MHVDCDVVPKIAEAYGREYDRELIGEGMGQLHVDFSFRSACRAIYAKETLFLGKKCYYDLLESVDKDGSPSPVSISA